MTKGLILLCAGGTGGHLFPAEAVAHELKARGYVVHLAADERVQKFAGDFPAEEIHRITSATLGSKNPVAMLKTGIKLLSGYMQSRKLIKRLQPVAVAGFGGYPTVPPVMAAAVMGVPTLVHEANAVLGRANRLLSKKVTSVAMGFGEANASGNRDIVITGNPVRPGILALGQLAYPTRKADDPFNLLVFGGSQGASFFSDCVPQALALLPEETRNCIRVVQQARPEDRESVVSDYEKLGVEAVVESFFTDMPDHLAKAHLVISRAGASTVSELSVAGRPAMLVPYPHALDHDQAANASLMAVAGGATIHYQDQLKPDVLSGYLSDYISNPKKLALAAENAKKTGRPDATSVLADMLEQIAGKEH